MEGTVILSSTQIETSAPQILCNLWKDQNFTEVTLVTADDKQITAHKAILSACSPFFQHLLITNPHPKPLLYLRGVQVISTFSLNQPRVTPRDYFQARELLCLVEYMYLGEIQVESQHLDTFLQVGEELGICGLRGREEEKTNTNVCRQVKSDQSSGLSPELNVKYVTAKQDITNKTGDNRESRIATQTQGQVEPPSSSEVGTTPQKLACKKCYIQFSSLRTLTRHTCKVNSRKFECKMCPSKFQLMNFLNLHMLEKHGKTNYDSLS